MGIHKPSRCILFLFGILVLPVTSIAAEAPSFIPLKVMCSVTTRDMPGVPTLKDGKEIEVTLKGLNSSKEGHQLVDKVGPYELWVVTSETLQDEKSGRTEIFTYNAEIRDTKTGLVSQGRSDDRLPARSGEPIKFATVGLARYGKSAGNSLLEIGNIRMSCHHHPSHDPAERLILKH